MSTKKVAKTATKSGQIKGSKNVGGAEAPVETTKKDAGMVELTVTQAYIDRFPQEAAEAGLQVGDVIEVTAKEAQEFQDAVIKDEEAPAEKPIKGAVAILRKGTEYVRTYTADQKEEVKEFLSKSSEYSAVPDESIVAIEVPYEVKRKDGSIERTEKRFTNKAEAIRFRNEHRSVCKVALK